jgi:hypothetical protein
VQAAASRKVPGMRVDDDSDRLSRLGVSRVPIEEVATADDLPCWSGDEVLPNVPAELFLLTGGEHSVIHCVDARHICWVPIHGTAPDSRTGNVRIRAPNHYPFRWRSVIVLWAALSRWTGHS